MAAVEAVPDREELKCMHCSSVATKIWPVGFHPSSYCDKHLEVAQEALLVALGHASY